MGMRLGWIAGCLAVFATGLRAEILIDPAANTPIYYAHPLLHSLVFVSPEARARSILLPAPIYVAPPPLIYRAPVGTIPYPPAGASGFNRSGAPANRDVAAYNIARAHAFSQNLYRKDDPVVALGGWLLYPDGKTYLYGWSTFYPPNAPGSNRPSNRDNASYLIERAHRFSQDAYRRP